jgi:GMP synthase-like glutamine amidotransferase
VTYATSRPALPVAVFRFSPTEGPGHFADWLDAHALPWQLFALDQGAAVPADSSAFAGIGMMGGPMAAYDALPWIAPISALLRDAVGREVPVIGHCLGGQLLAQALGARVARAPVPEIGWFDVDVDVAPAAREWFGGRDRFTTFQWHYDGFALPDGARRVLTGAVHANQAYVVDGRHIGMQCHVEMTAALVESWLGADAGELEGGGAGVQPAAAIRAAAAVHLSALNAVAAAVYARWAQGRRR